MKKVLNLLYLLSYLSLIVKFPQTLSYPKMTACIITLRPVNLYLLFLILLLPIQSIAAGFRLDQIAQLPGIPWGMDFINQNKLIITLRSGSLILLNVQKGEFSHLSGLPEITADGQGGLLDVAIGPNYQTQGWIFFTYSKTTDRGDVTTLARAKIDGSNLVNWQNLLITDSATDTGRHFGSRIAFDNEGHVFFGIGDRGVRKNSQNTGNHAGSILRLTLDGKVPPDNPFASQNVKWQKNKRAEIWSYGHRNPQGLLFDPEKQILWEIEHGPRGGDEINLIKKGQNYGWPVVSHGKEYWGPFSVGEGTEKPGMVNPHKVYIPSIAPGSLMLYRGDAFPEWKGNLFAGALKLQHLNRVTVASDNRLINEERLLLNLKERIRALTESPEGWIYFSTDSGKIMRLRPEM